MNIKAVIFDYGQVISLPQDRGAIDTLAKMAGAELTEFEKLLWRLRPDYDRGIVSAVEYFDRILSHLGISLDEKIIKEMIEIDLASWQSINAGTVELMEDVRKAGYIPGILSNMPHEFLAWARVKLPVFSLAQVSLFSCEVNLIKPEEAIYRRLLAKLETESRQPMNFGELVFFDDSADNIRSASALGINAFLWESPEAARRELISLGAALR